MSLVLRADAWVRDRLQSVYDRLLDRFGIYLGTVRAICFAMIWILIGLSFYLHGAVEGHPLAGLVSITFYLLVIFGVLWRASLAEHLGPEWKDQDQGRYERINAKSEMRRGGTALLLRGVVFATVGLLQGWLHADEPVKLPCIALATVFGLLWCWSLELKVRARKDTSHARQPEFAR